MMDWFRRWVLHNLLLKIIALASAVLLWSAVARQPMIEVAYSVPIEFHQVPEDLEITTEVVPQAQVRLRGPSRRIREMNAGEVHPVVDLGSVQPGERTFDLTTAQVRVPYDVEVVQIIPAHVRLAFDRRASKQVPVRPRVIGNLPAGFAIASITSDPPAITVVGPERRVNAVEAALTDPVDATGITGRAGFTTNAYVADPLVREARPTPIHVTVTTERINKPQ
jgi:YbbR domain-containing protein